MSASFLRIVGQPSPVPAPSQAATGDGTPPSVEAPRAARSLCCLPMAEIHGAFFLRTIAASISAPVLDARLYPYFDLHGLWRSGAFQSMENACCRYMHAAIELGPLQDNASRWRRRKALHETLNEAAGYGFPDRSIVLVNRAVEVEVLSGLLRGLEAHDGRGWSAHLHEAVDPFGTPALG